MFNQVEAIILFWFETHDRWP